MLRDLSALTSGGRGILGTYLVGGLASDMPSGFAKPGLLNNDVDAANDPVGCLYRVEITSWPSAGTLTVNENGALSFIGAPDGTYTGTERIYKNGAAVYDTTYSFTIGAPSTAKVSSDLTGSYAIRAAISADLIGSFAIRKAISADLLGSYSIRASVSRDFAGSYSIAGVNGGVQQNTLTVPAARTAAFAGRQRVILFSGKAPVSAAKGVSDELYYVGDFTKDLGDSGTSALSVAPVSAGVAVLEGPVLQGGLGVVKLGALDTSGAPTYFTFRVTCVNGEVFDRTIAFTVLDDRTWKFGKDPDDKRLYTLDVSADARYGSTSVASVQAPVVVGVSALSAPVVQGNLAIVMIGGLDVSDGATNSYGLTVLFANTEKISRTIYFTREDH